MRKNFWVACWIFFAVVKGIAGAPYGAMKEQRADAWEIERMTCEYRGNPLGVDEPHPRFGWVFRSSERNQYQSAYRILVASTREKLEKNIGDIWDSGMTPSKENINAFFGGKQLASFTRYFWKVMAINQSGRPSAWSAVAWFETAFMQAARWQGCWIGNGRIAPEREEDFYRNNPAPFFRKVFDLGKRVQSARLYISGLGYYEAYINGKRVGDQVLDPGWTNYARTVLYSVYDITKFVKTGANTVGILLGNGWYNPLPLRLFGAFDLRKVLTIGEPRVIANIRIQFTDGTIRVISTDRSWTTADSYILKNNIYLGEEQDGRLADARWAAPGRVRGHWTAAVAAAGPGGSMKAQMSPPIRITKLLPAAGLTEPAPGVFVFDLGQNFAGWIRMELHGHSGEQVRFRYGELLYPDGRVNGMTTVAGHIKAIWHINAGAGAPSTAYQEDSYTCSGERVEFFQPHFTFHAFRYVEVTGLSERPELGSLQGLRLNADLPEAGHFACSNPLLNRVQEMSLASFLSNVFSVQSDCPGRERQGYGADMVVSSEAFIYNFDMSCFYTKTVEDFAADARPEGGMPECAPYNGITTDGFHGDAGPAGWQLAYPYLQEKLYRFYGNRKILQDQYERTKKMVEFLRSKAVDNLIDHDIGDHVAVNAKHVPLTSGAFYYHHVQLLVEFARILGMQRDAVSYQGLADSIRDSFNRHYLMKPSGAQDGGEYDTAYNETTQVFPLWYGLVPEAEKEGAFKHLLDAIRKNDDHVSTGIFGTKMLFDVLRRFDRGDIAYRINTQRDYPGYGYMLENGATTLWETWEKPDQNSWNHPMFGSVSEWFYRELAGINPAEDAFGMDRLVIKPFFGDDLQYVKAEYSSVRGKIVSDWEKKDGVISWRLVLPPNTRARVYVPASRIGQILESGRPVKEVGELHFLGMGNGYAAFDAVSGEYYFTIQ